MFERRLDMRHVCGVVISVALAAAEIAVAEDNMLRIERSTNLSEWSAMPVDPALMRDGWLRAPENATGEFFRVRIQKPSVLAMAKVRAFAQTHGSDPARVPAVEDFFDLGIRGATQAYLAQINAQILKGGWTAVDSVEKLQSLVDDLREGTYDIYVSSQTGNDSNDGKSSASAFATLARAEAAALARGDGVAIRLAHGSLWRESLDLSKLNNVTIGGGVATIDCSDIVTGLTPHVSLANVWQVAWPVANFGAPAASYAVLCSEGSNAEDATLLWDVTTGNLTGNENQVAATPGSFYFDMAKQILYVNPRKSANPTTSGKTFVATRRIYGLRTGTGAIVEGLITRRSGHNNGSCVVGDDSTLRRILAQTGHKHNLLVGAGGSPVVEDVVLLEAREADGAGGGCLVVFYARDPNTCDVNVKRLIALGSLDGTPRVNTTVAYGHGGSSSDALRSITVEGLLTDRHAYAFSAATRRLTVRGAFFDHFGALPTLVVAGTRYTDHATDVRYACGRHSMSTTNRPAGYTYALSDSAFYWEGPGAFMQMTGNGITALIMENVSLLTASGAKLSLGSSLMASITQNYCIIVGAHATGSLVVAKPVGVPYTGDHNVFWRGWGNTSGPFFGSFDGTSISTLQSWQSVSGQDANSVTLATADQVAGGANAFWLGWAQAVAGTDLTTVGPAMGDFRINPNARVYAGNGTAFIGKFPDNVPLSAAGAQAFWDFNSGAPVSGPPQRWPVMPTTLEQAKSYIAAPESWAF